MYSATLLSFVFLGVSMIRAAPIYKRADPKFIHNLNPVQLSTPIIQECVNDFFDSDGIQVQKCGTPIVNGLTAGGRIAQQIACLTDETVCLQQGNTTAVCTNKRQFCEEEEETFAAGVPFNSDGEKDEAEVSFLTKLDSPECKATDRPIVCGAEQQEDGLLHLDETSSPSKFLVDNDFGHTLIGTKAGPIGVGFQKQVMDNGNGTFTAGNLTTPIRSFALQLGCLFDEAECKQSGAPDACAGKRVDCERANKILRKNAAIAQVPSGPKATLPAGVTLPEVTVD